MLRQTIRSLVAHRLRLLLTTVAVVLGVGFVSGTYVLTDTMNSAFDDVFATATEGVDVQVRAASGGAGADGSGAVTPVPAELLDTVGEVDGVAGVSGSVQVTAQVLDPSGEPVGGQGPPTLGMSVTPDDWAPEDVTAGTLPDAPDEIVIDAPTATDTGYTVGDRVTVVLPTGTPQQFTLSGTVDPGQVAGATIVGWDLASAQQLFDRENQFDSLTVEAASGVAAGELRDRVAAAVGPEYEAVTGDDLAAEQSADIREGLGFFNIALLAFGAVALFVGAFIINNTFAIIVAQRTRELALLRCLGASRAQVRNSVLLESLIVGVVASATGLLLGVLLAMGMLEVLGLVGFELPATTPQVQGRTVAFALAVGIAVTVASALIPARKATRVPPVAALREEAVDLGGTRTRLRTLLGSLVTLAGAGGLVYGLFADPAEPLYFIGGGALVSLLGVGALGPVIARPLARAIGYPFVAGFRLPGKLARQNAMRNPKRTAATASALMIGLALISFVSILGASTKQSVIEQTEASFISDYVIVSGSTFGPSTTPVSPDVVDQLRERPEVAAVAGLATGAATIAGSSQNPVAANPGELQQVLDLDTPRGGLADMTEGSIAVAEDTAVSNGWRIGSEIPVSMAAGEDTLTLAATYDSDVIGPYLLTTTDYQRLSGDDNLAQVFVDAAGGIPAADARAALEGVLDGYPTLTLQDQTAFMEQITSGIDQLLNIFYGLLGLSVLIALFGIVNTLVLSVFERIRELGLLRAIGMERRQVRAMIRWEAVIIAVMGALLGMVVGTFFSWTTVQGLSGEGLSTFSLPFGQLAAFLVLAALAGILAAVAPGRRAARIDMLRAIATE